MRPWRRRHVLCGRWKRGLCAGFALGLCCVLPRLASALSFPVGGEFQLNSYTTNNQRYAAVAENAAGNFVVVWQSVGPDGSNEGVFGQRFDSSGGMQGTGFQRLIRHTSR